MYVWQKKNFKWSKDYREHVNDGPDVLNNGNVALTAISEMVKQGKIDGEFDHVMAVTG